MPLFEYDCQACGHQFETLVLNGHKPKCPSCESPRLAKRLSTVSTPRSGSGGDALPIGGGCSDDLPPCGPACCKL